MSITTKSALSALETLESHYFGVQVLELETVETVTRAMSGSLQFRDYVMGELPTKYDIHQAVNFLSAIASLTETEHLPPVLSVLSSFQYEADNVEGALASLDKANEIDGNYALANLLRRTIQAGWPSNTFARMRSDLHPKVTATIQDELDLEIA